MDEFITLSHGNGGVKTSKLIKEMFLSKLGNCYLNSLEDGAALNVSNRIAFTTDSYVISPYFFKGGDIGKLSVCGTVNDLIMCGSIPKYLTLSLILEESFSMSELEKIINSIAETAEYSGVKIVTGDTKVVDKGHGHGIYINTAGIGELISGVSLNTENIEEGDAVICTGNIGDHGVSILCSREGLLEFNLSSDCTPLIELIPVIIKFKEDIKALRDPTRGGVATVLNEFAENSDCSIEINEESLPLDEKVKFACEMLGLDPLYSANEGKALMVVKKAAAEKILEELRKYPVFFNSKIIGEAIKEDKAKVLLKSELGGRRIIDKLSYDILPRIC
ncbi:hydrogenase expression/formation protein HypE [Clostridium polynesiense]|uniref:hydrogenase expression/formation protein HypE n=1 Tax=Clostridium polynesiense TaxID=1325933 RepID=UPI0005908C7E|nr:hydrogenase expression/formation protein HypE [Clostridium polynesiense]